MLGRKGDVSQVQTRRELYGIVWPSPVFLATRNRGGSHPGWDFFHCPGFPTFHLLTKLRWRPVMFVLHTLLRMLRLSC